MTNAIWPNCSITIISFICMASWPCMMLFILLWRNTYNIEYQLLGILYYRILRTEETHLASSDFLLIKIRKKIITALWRRTDFLLDFKSTLVFIFGMGLHSSSLECTNWQCRTSYLLKVCQSNVIFLPLHELVGVHINKLDVYL